MTFLSYAQSSNAPLEKGYYIVVGAFSPNKEEYARKWSDKLIAQGYPAVYGLDAKRKILLVYIDKYAEYDPSISTMLETRKKNVFPEAWVRIIKESAPAEAKPNEVKQTPSQTTPTETPPADKPKEPALTETKEPTLPKDSVISKPVEVVVDVKKPDDKKKRDPNQPPTFDNTPLLFNFYDANSNLLLDGSIELVDAQRARLMKSVKSTDTVYLPNPNSDTGVITLITDAFGYRKVQHEINYKNPMADTATHFLDYEDGYFVVHFEMSRLHKGDIATLYHVYFYNDAAIMMPESKYELYKLLQMMKDTNFKVTLHGHTNGNAHGRIISMGPSKEFFSVNAPDVKETVGSSKALSGMRAEVIKEWLVSQGISGDRIAVKAWGGRRMLHDKNSANARKNVRVEVEILEE